MKRTILSSLLWLSLSACGEKDDTGDTTPPDADTDTDTDADTDTDTDADTDSDTDTDTDSDTDTDADTDTDTGADTLPDPFEGLESDPDCETYEGIPHAGATSYFIGDYELEGTGVSGMEYWLLFANTTWAEGTGADCQVVWNITGTTGDPTPTCVACEYSMAVEGSLDPWTTTCDEDLYAGAETFETTYNVDVDGDETSFTFASNGTALGSGYTNGIRVTWVSEGSCMWF